MALTPIPRPLARDHHTVRWLRSVVNWIMRMANWREEPDPLSQYLLEADALQIFSFAAYAQMEISEPKPFPSLGAGWQPLDVFDSELTESRGVDIDLDSSTFTFNLDGVYVLNLSGSFEHNSSNQGRTTNVRLYDLTTGTPLFPRPVGIGRNVEDTTLAAVRIVEIVEERKNDVFRVEIGGGDSVTSVQFNALQFSVWNVGEWREPLPSDDE